MMSASTIYELQERARKKAKRNKTEPYEIWPGDVNRFPPFPFPSIGNYNHPRWDLVKTYFVDSTGSGEDDEGAMSTRQLIAKLKVGYAYAIVEQGQFQLVVGEYKLKRTKKKVKKAVPVTSTLWVPACGVNTCPGCVNCGRGLSNR